MIDNLDPSQPAHVTQIQSFLALTFQKMTLSNLGLTQLISKFLRSVFSSCKDHNADALALFDHPNVYNGIPVTPTQFSIFANRLLTTPSVF